MKKEIEQLLVEKVKQVRLVSGRSCCVDLEVWSFSPRGREEVTYRLTWFTEEGNAVSATFKSLEDVIDYVDQRWSKREVCDA